MCTIEELLTGGQCHPRVGLLMFLWVLHDIIIIHLAEEVWLQEGFDHSECCILMRQLLIVERLG